MLVLPQYPPSADSLGMWLHIQSGLIKNENTSPIELKIELICWEQILFFSRKKICQILKSKISLSSMRVRRSYSQGSKYSWVLSNGQIWARNSISASRSSIWSILPCAESALSKWARSLNQFSISCSLKEYDVFGQHWNIHILFGKMLCLLFSTIFLDRFPKNNRRFQYWNLLEPP